MKKLSIIFAVLLVLLSTLAFGVGAEENVVVFTGNKFGSLANAIDVVAEGGTVVLAEHYEISPDEALKLPAKKVTITSKYGGTDYAQNGVYLGLGKALELSADLTLENVVIKQTSNNKNAWGAIYANGHHLTIGEGVVTVANESSKLYPSIFGGANAKGALDSTYVTVMSGDWNNVFGGGYSDTQTNAKVEFLGGNAENVFGGSYAGKFTGNTEVYFKGGFVNNVLNGGSRIGTFTGDTIVDVSGGSITNLAGAMYGLSGSSATFNGDVQLNIHGNAKILMSTFGSSYYSGVKMNGDINIDIYENANLCRHLYGGGFSGGVTTGEKGILVTIRDNVLFSKPTGNNNVVCAGPQSGTVTGNVKIVIKDNVTIPGNVYGGGYKGTVKGNSVAEIYGGTVTVNFTAGTRQGKITGNADTYAYGGVIGYYSASDVYGITASGAIVNDSTYGTVSGTSIVVVDGADIAGEVTLGKAKGTITVKSGKIPFVTGTVTVDVSGNKLLRIGGTVNAVDLIGGGEIMLSSSGTIIAQKGSGDITLSVQGTPVANHQYLQIKETADNVKVNYKAVDDEISNKTSLDGYTSYSVSYPERFDLVNIRVNYSNPKNNSVPQIVMGKGVHSDEGRTSVSLAKSKDGDKYYAEAKVTPGLYYFKVYYGNGTADYVLKYFYVTGKTESQTYTVEHSPYVANSFSEKHYFVTTDEVMALLGTDTLIGYKKLTTPTFTKHSDDARAFLTNADVCEYVEGLANSFKDAYVFYPFETTELGNRTPVVIFTRDNISGLSFEQAATKIRNGGVRDILMISGGVHGNEPAGIEGVLALAGELCGDYGKEVLDSFGAIVMMPIVSVDNHMRFVRNSEDGTNPNRDLVALSQQSTRNQVYVYKNLMPTIYIDCHEDYADMPIDPADISIENLDDICIRYSGTYNSTLRDVYASLNGGDQVTDFVGYQMMINAIKKTGEYGLRSSVYYHTTYTPVNSKDYPTARGAYGYIIETMRIATGQARYERAVFAMQRAFMSLVDEFVAQNGQLARNVHEAKLKFESFIDYDPNRLYALSMTTSGRTAVVMPRPLIYADGKYKDEFNTKTFKMTDAVNSTRPLPTAYVIVKGAPNTEKMLELLDLHGISYVELKAGSELELRKYSGTYSSLAIGDPATVTFNDGAYAVTLNTVDAFLIAALFEPDSVPWVSEAESLVSFAHLGWFNNKNPIYRSEVSGVVDIIRTLDVNYDPNAPVTEPVTEPITEPVTEPTSEPTTEPVTDDTPSEPSETNSNLGIILSIVIPVVVLAVIVVLIIVKKKK